MPRCFSYRFPKKKLSFFAVYDGHGGANVAKFCGQNLHLRLARSEALLLGDYRRALKECFLSIDAELRDHPDFKNDPAGCTAIVAVYTEDNRLFVANAGDSRAVISSRGKAHPLSYDHKPTLDVEQKRIVNAGGYVDFGRVNGNLALSRAIGDFEFKQSPHLSPEAQVVTADPDILEWTLNPETDEFVVLACDGIWDVRSNQEVVDFVRKRMVEEGMSYGKIAEELMDWCLAPDSMMGGLGCDNMTVVIVGLLFGKDQADLIRRCSQPTAANDPEGPARG